MAVWLTAQQAADYLKFPTVGAFHVYLHRRRKSGFPVRAYRRGRALLFTEADLDASLTCEQSRKLRRTA